MAYNEDVNINLNILAGAMGGITAIAGGMSALTSTFGQFGTTAVDSFGTIDGLLVSATAMLGVFGIEAANAFGEFEQGMKIVQAVSGQTNGAIKELGDQASQLSVQYRTAIGDITEGLQTLGRAGLNSAETQLQVLEDGLQTAKLEGRNLNGVLEELIQNTAMLGGNLDSLDFGEQTKYVNSLMVGTSMSAPIDTHDISQTLQYVGGTAAAAGANLEDKEKLEDLMGTIAAFAQKGVTGSMAGTALRAFLTKPASQDKSVVEGLGRIGLSPDDLWENGGESMKDISDQIALIQKQMDRLNLSTMDQLEIWGKIVGPKMGQQMIKLEADKIDKLKGDIQSAASAEELATSTLSTYNQKVNEMDQISSGIFRQLGSNIVMWLNPALEVINKILSLFNNQAGGLLLFGGTIAVVSRGIQALRGMIGSIVSQIRSAFSEIRGQLANISGSQSTAVDGATRYDSIIQKAAADIALMNNNLMETNTLWGQFQSLALGKQATAQIRGYNKDNPMDPGLLGVTDNYTQYFRKPITGHDYSAYKFDKPFGINEAQYESLSKSDKRHFEQISDLTYVPKKKVISEDDYSKLSERVQKYFKETTISQLEYDAMNSIQRKPYSKTDKSYIMNPEEMYEHLNPGGYESLSPTDKKLFSGQNYRIEDRIADEREMNRRIEESRKNLRIVDEHTWKEATAKEKELIRERTKELGDAMAEQSYRSQEKIYAKDSEGNFIRDSKGNKVDTGMRSFQTYHNIPKSEDLAELTARQKREYANAMVQAQRQADFEATKQSARNTLGTRGRMRFDGMENLRKSSNTATNAINKLSSAVTGNSNRLNQEGRLVQSTFQKIRSSIGGGIQHLTKFTQGFSLTSEQIDSLGAKFLALTADSTTLDLKAKTTENMFSELAVKLGLTDKEFAELVLSSQAVQAKFQQISGATPTEIGDVAGKKLNSGFGKLSGALSEVVGLMGGPFSAALMGVTVIIQAVQMAFQNYQQELQKAQQELSEASQKRSEYEQNIKDIYSQENSELTEADLNRALNAQYGSIGHYETGSSLDTYGSPYVPGDVYYQIKEGEDPKSRLGDEEFVDELELASEDNIKALNDNTVQLAAATAEYARAANKVSEKLNDGWWGSFVDSNEGDQAIDNAAFATWFSDIELFKDARNMFKGDSPHMLASQKADDYAGSQELAGLIAADAQRFGAESGLATVFGTDIDDMRTKLGGIESNTYKSAMNLARNFANPNMSPEQAAAAQVSLKEHKEDYQRLGKSLAKREFAMAGMRQTNPLMDAKLGSGNLRIKGGGTDLPKSLIKDQKKTNKTAEQQLKELRSIDKDIDNTVARLIKDSNGKLNAGNIIAMAQLQQFQDMYTIAQNQIAPGILSTVEQCYANVVATQGAGSAAADAAGGANSAAGNAEIIAQFLAQQAIDKAYESSYNDEKRKNPLVALMGKDIYESLVSNDTLDKWTGAFSQQRENIGRTVSATGLRLNNPNMSWDDAWNEAGNRWNEVHDSSKYPHQGFSSILNTLSGNIKAYAEGATLAEYMNSDVGEGGSHSNPSGSGGGGGGDGGGGGGSGDDSGRNTKNRVDLVLCNKKEIPKLNVNLFKKEPNFTVLNKNFKLRDIKINTKDTPKSILDAVKNGIIDTAKRMDPKIIQDEEAVYDPMGATEGTPTPSGTTPTG